MRDGKIERPRGRGPTGVERSTWWQAHHPDGISHQGRGVEPVKREERARGREPPGRDAPSMDGRFDRSSPAAQASDGSPSRADGEKDPEWFQHPERRAARPAGSRRAGGACCTGEHPVSPTGVLAHGEDRLRRTRARGLTPTPILRTLEMEASGRDQRDNGWSRQEAGYRFLILVSSHAVVFALRRGTQRGRWFLFCNVLFGSAPDRGCGRWHSKGGRGRTLVVTMVQGASWRGQSAGRDALVVELILHDAPFGKASASE